MISLSDTRHFIKNFFKDIWLGESQQEIKGLPKRNQ